MSSNSRPNRSKKRNESGIHGKHYERKVLALIALKCLLDKDVKDFWILSNPREVDKFDDIILFTEHSNGEKKLFMMQIKHKDEERKRPVVAEKLDSTDNKLGLKKYEEAYFKIKQGKDFLETHEISSETEMFFILFNNCTVNQEIVNENIGFSRTDSFKFINTSSNPNSILTITNKSKKYNPNFINQFYFYTEQVDIESINNEIRSLLAINDDTAKIIVNFFYTWVEKDNCMKLWKLDVKVKLLDILISDFIPPHPLEEINESVLNNILNKFDVTVIAQKTSSVLIWNEIFHEIQNFSNDLRIEFTDWDQLIPKHVKDKLSSSFTTNSDTLSFYNESITIRLLYIFMIIQRRVPLFLTTSNRLFNSFISKLLPALNIYSVVFNIKKQSLNFLDTIKVFQNFNDIEDEIYINYSRKLMISFQGKTDIDLYNLIKYSNIIKYGTNIMKEISVDVYIDLLHKKCVVGRGNELPTYYINRQVKVPVLKSNVFNEDECVFFIFNFPWNAKIKNHTSINIVDLILSYDELYEKPHHIITTQIPFTSAYTNFIQDLSSHRTYFILEYLNLDSFLLMQTNGSVEILRPYLTYHLEKDTSITNIFKNCNVNLICNNAGMGKSTFLSFINSQLSSKHWVIHMNLKEHSATIKKLKTVEELINFSYNCHTANLSEQFHTFLTSLYSELKEQIIWLVDDYEEVCEPGLLDLFKSASKEGFKIWIVARPHLKLEFEKVFGVLSMELTELNKRNQRKFIEKYLNQKNKDKNDIKGIMKAIDNVRHMFEDSFIGTWQQIMMLTEIFLNPENNLKEHEWYIHDIYEKFINLKVDNDYGIRKEWYIRTACKLALKVFFRDEALKNVFDLEEFDEDVRIFKNDYPKDFFVTGFGKDGIPIFSHTTYAEFLAARWILHTVKKQMKGNTPSDMTTIFRMLYLKELTTVRLFIDNMITKQLPLHSAIVNKEQSKVIQLISEEDHVSKTDFLGRSIFHLFSAYGSYFDTGITMDTSKLRNLDEHSEIMRDGDNILFLPVELIKPPDELNTYVIKCISENSVSACKKCILQRDDFLQMNCFDYAMLSGSLLELDTLLHIQNDIANSLLSEEMKYCLLFHSIKNRYNNILLALDVEGLNNVKIGQTEMSLLHLAVTSENLEAIKILTKEHCLKEWGVDKQGNTPLHLACNKKNNYILEYFFGKVDLDAEFLNKKNLEGQSHLYFLARRGHVKWIKQIIQNFPDIDIDSECYNGNTPFVISVIFSNVDAATVLKGGGANVNHYNNNNKTALHYAASKGFLSCVKQLLEWKVTVNYRDDHGKTPLMKASSWGHIYIVKLLLANNAEVNVCDYNQWTALHHAVRRNNKQIIRLLLKHKADVNCHNNKQESPIIMACKRDLSKALKALMSCKQKICDLDEALKVSIKHNSKRCMDILFQAGV